jgi:hypothetical protein
LTTRKRLQAKAQKRDLAMAALHLRASGATYKQIAQALDLPNVMAAWRLVTVEVDNAIRESAREVLGLELTRLDRMLMAVWADAIQGDPPSIDKALKIEDMRCRLLGLYDRTPDTDRSPSEGVVVISAETSSDDYIAALRVLRGELPLPPSNGGGNGHQPPD